MVTATQQFTNPKLAQAQADLNLARQRFSMADSIMSRRLHDRETQERAEEALRRDGLEPVYWTPTMLGVDHTRNERRLIRIWVSDEAMIYARNQFEETKQALDEAEALMEKARGLPQVGLEAIRTKAAKSGAKYMIIKPMKIGPTDYWPGDLLPPKVQLEVGYRKVDEWSKGRAPTIRLID